MQTTNVPENTTTLLKKKYRALTPDELARRRHIVLDDIRNAPLSSFDFWDLLKLNVPKGLILKNVRSISIKEPRDDGKIIRKNYWKKDDVLAFLENRDDWYPQNLISSTAQQAHQRAKRKQDQLPMDIVPLSPGRLPLDVRARKVYRALRDVFPEGHPITTRMIAVVGNVSLSYAHRVVESMVKQHRLEKDPQGVWRLR
ncbi:hypothetical protein BXT84_14070 [Sulfobacillus thermotolerans]|uniref:Uncharacterized protein n=1 Tax=Sulfobacillus thermotolerans TaxID=338644 RepID=A0ABM6RUD2_9FIRM|nr:hypothetical protein BXT84_14070 [Sulfobacillus thermotolerans]